RAGKWVTRLPVGAESSTSGRSKRGSVWCAGNAFRSKSNPGTSILGSGAAAVVRTRSAIWNCCTPTATGRDTRRRRITDELAASCEGRWRRLEPYDGKLSRTVLRGRGDSNVALLPD